jgi:hypothetical protein
METLRSRSEIEINEEALKSLQITGEKKKTHPHSNPEARAPGAGMDLQPWKSWQSWSEICE